MCHVRHAPVRSRSRSDARVLTPNVCKLHAGSLRAARGAAQPIGSARRRAPVAAAAATRGTEPDGWRAWRTVRKASGVLRPVARRAAWFERRTERPRRSRTEVLPSVCEMRKLVGKSASKQWGRRARENRTPRTACLRASPVARERVQLVLSRIRLGRQRAPSPHDPPPEAGGRCGTRRARFGASHLGACTRLDARAPAADRDLGASEAGRSLYASGSALRWNSVARFRHRMARVDADRRRSIEGGRAVLGLGRGCR